jgi:UDP-glucuronate decarboxylase
MKINDARAPADFANSIIYSNDITLYSDGQPTRTFCYVTDAISGYLKSLLYGKFETFNIGNPDPEITINKLAEIYYDIGKQIFNYKGKITFKKSNDNNYLANNPQRRSPLIDKARKLLSYTPKIGVKEGVFRFLTFLKQSNKEDLKW